MSVIEDYKEYLRKKHQGGLNSRKGNTMEEFYATFQIADYMTEAHPEEIFLDGQKENAFVDDLYIKEYNKQIYIQVKDVERLTWDTGSKKHTILSDFELQKKACEEAGDKDFRLRLVYSNEQSKVTAIPKSIHACTKVEHFKSADDINACILNNDRFKRVLQSLTDYTSQDDLVVLGTSIFGIWAAGNQKNVSVDSVINQLKEINNTHIVLKTYPVFEITDACKAIFDKIGLSYIQNGNIVRMSFKAFNAEKYWTESIDKTICDSNPRYIFDLLRIVNQN